MKKNSIIAVVLSCLVLGGYIYFTGRNSQPVPAKPEEEAKVENVAEESTEVESAEVAEKGDEDIASEIAEEIIENASDDELTVETNKVKVKFSQKGGDVISFELLEHNDDDQKVQMAFAKNNDQKENTSDTNRAFAISIGTGREAIINDLFNVKKTGSKDGIQQVTFTKTFKDYKLIKTYSFMPEDYMFKLNVKIEGTEEFKGLNSDASGGKVAYTLRTSPQIGPFFDNHYDFRDFLIHNNSKVKDKSLTGNNKDYEKYDSSYNWSGVGGKYFCELIIPEETSRINGTYYSSKSGDFKDTVAQAFVERKGFTDKEVNDVYYIYVGSRSEKELRKYASADNNGWNFHGRNLGDALRSGGFLGWLESILKWMLELSYKIINNWGVAIIITTIVLRLILFPLTYKQSLGTLKMQQMQPKMKAIQEKYKDNPQKLQAETAKLYQQSGYNPMSGCLPLIFQMMALIAMYNLFNNYFEFRGASFVKGWIDDLSMGDSVAHWNANIIFIGNNLRILPIIYLVSQLFYGKITQMQAAGQSTGSMKFMTYGLPIIFSFLFYNAPAGLLLFWTVSNLLQMVQQVVINKVMSKKRAEAEGTSNLKHFTKQGKKK